MRRVISAAIVGLALSSTADGKAAPEPGPRPLCRQGGAAFALGERYSDRLARRARRGADARVVRKIEPGQVYTMEFRADRLNLEVDRRGRIRSVRCG